MGGTRAAAPTVHGCHTSLTHESLSCCPVASRFYVCDTARLFPPLPPDRAVRGSHLTRLMRPEAVKHSGEPLSSDAFTRFGIHRAREHNAHVRPPPAVLLSRTPALVDAGMVWGRLPQIRAATKHLVQERLPAAASKLNGDLDITSYDIISLLQELQVTHSTA